jgi:hypothetical protein
MPTQKGIFYSFSLILTRKSTEIQNNFFSLPIPIPTVKIQGKVMADKQYLEPAYDSVRLHTGGCLGGSDSWA